MRLNSRKLSAAPLLAATRQRFNEQLAAKDAEVARKTKVLRKEQGAVAKAREQIEDQVTQRLTAERSQLVAAEGKKARDAVAGVLKPRRLNPPNSSKIWKPAMLS